MCDQERAMLLAAYCALQAKIIQLFDPSYDDVAMLQELSPAAIKAARRPTNRSLKALERISNDLEQRIARLKDEKPVVAESNEARELFELQMERKAELGL